MYDWIELTKLWEVERVTTEQVIGQLINHGEAQHRTLVALQRRQEQIEQAIAGLTVRVTQLEGNRAGPPSA